MGQPVASHSTCAGRHPPRRALARKSDGDVPHHCALPSDTATACCRNAATGQAAKHRHPDMRKHPSQAGRRGRRRPAGRQALHGLISGPIASPVRWPLTPITVISHNGAPNAAERAKVAAQRRPSPWGCPSISAAPHDQPQLLNNRGWALGSAGRGAVCQWRPWCTAGHPSTSASPGAVPHFCTTLQRA